MKKVIRYMQDQAVEYSGHQRSSTYLAPPGKEPQQRGQHAPTHDRIRGYNRIHHTTSAAHTYSTHTSGASGPNPIPKDIIKHQYAQDNILQSYEVYIPEISGESLSRSQKFWVIYIHGGYYRDPEVSASSFHRALSILVSSPIYSNLRSSIEGYASINYRLSPHPDHPQDPTKTEEYEIRNAKHPDHIDDVSLAIIELQRKYDFGSNYLLVGHSVGATLAFQVALCQSVPWHPPTSTPNSTTSTSEPTTTVSPPSAILALSGIYSFPILHKSFPSYLTMTTNALGPSPSTHTSVSPATYPASTYLQTWIPTHGRRRIVFFAQSPQDSLIDGKQVEAMIDALDDEDNTVSRSLSMATTINAANPLSRVMSNAGFNVQEFKLKGGHNHCWEQGEGLAKAIGAAVQAMRKAEREEGVAGAIKDYGIGV